MKLNWINLDGYADNDAMYNYVKLYQDIADLFGSSLDNVYTADENDINAPTEELFWDYFLNDIGVIDPNIKSYYDFYNNNSNEYETQSCELVLLYNEDDNGDEDWNLHLDVTLIYKNAILIGIVTIDNDGHGFWQVFAPSTVLVDERKD